MKFNINGNIDITEAMRNHLETRIGRVEKYFPDGIDASVYVNVKVHKNSHKVEITIKTPSDLVFRAEEVTDDFYYSVDASIDKLERQIRKYKTKVNRKGKTNNLKNTFPTTYKEVEEGIIIKRRKRFSLKPMSVDEAILQMEMLSHNFFVFLDAETSGTSVVYKRKDGAYGLIET